MTLVPGPWGLDTGAPEVALAQLLSRPDAVRSVHQPVVDLIDGGCAGYQAVVRLAEWVGRESSPWFGVAARAGLGERLGRTVLEASLRSRATLPGHRFLVVTVSARELADPGVLALLEAEDDVADVVLRLAADTRDPAARPTGPVPPYDLPDPARLEGLRARGLLIAVSCGQAGIHDLEAVLRWRPDMVRLPEHLVRDLPVDPVRQGLVDVVVGLGAAVLADGVESLAEVAALRDLGVRWGQGWLFGRPRSGFAPPAVDLQDWLVSR